MRCVIILKKDGGNTNSKLTRHWTTSFCNLGRICGSITFWEIALRNAHSFTMGTRTFSGRSPINATGSNCVIITWQSWDFRFWNFFSAIFIIPFIFNEKPAGTLILLRHSKKISFSALVRAYLLKYLRHLSVYLLYGSFIRCWSARASGVSFVFPYMPKKPSRFTQRFFVTCITSIEDRTSRTFQ